MSKIRILSVVLASTCVAAPAMAEDNFRALSQLPSGVAPMSEAKLAAVEGGGGTGGGGSCTTSGSIIVVQCNVVQANLLGNTLVPAVGAVAGLLAGIL